MDHADVFLSLKDNFARIIALGDSNRFQTNATKTNSLVVSRKVIPPQPDLVFNGTAVKCSSSLNVLGLIIYSGLTWKEHINGIAAVASQKLGFLFGVRSYFSITQLLALHKSLVRPHLEYCSHTWAGAAEYHLELLNKNQRRATRLVGNAILIFQLAPLDGRRKVAFLSLFYR